MLKTKKTQKWINTTGNEALRETESEKESNPQNQNK